MWLENPIFREDMERICCSAAVPWKMLEGKTVLVTGATGLIGSTLVSALLYYGLRAEKPIQVVALVRSAARARERFAGQMADCGNALQFLESDVTEKIILPQKVDYIIHGASQTASRAFVEQPVETIRTALQGTENLLELARENSVKSFVYLSSMEVYGAPETDEPLSETCGTNIDTMRVRSCYPEAKRMCENLCASYCSEYGVPAKVIRLSQTFGPGVGPEDARVFAEFARCATSGKNIILQTEGTSKRPYLYTADAVTAILTVLLKGANGEAYNAANPSTYCSVREMADMVAREIGGGKIEVQFSTNRCGVEKFSPPHHLNLQIDKLAGLDWSASTELKEMYLRMIAAQEKIKQ